MPPVMASVPTCAGGGSRTSQSMAEGGSRTRSEIASPPTERQCALCSVSLLLLSSPSSSSPDLPPLIASTSMSLSSPANAVKRAFPVGGACEFGTLSASDLSSFFFSAVSESSSTSSASFGMPAADCGNEPSRQASTMALSESPKLSATATSGLAGCGSSAAPAAPLVPSGATSTMSVGGPSTRGGSSRTGGSATGGGSSMGGNSSAGSGEEGSSSSAARRCISASFSGCSCGSVLLDAASGAFPMRPLSMLARTSSAATIAATARASSFLPRPFLGILSELDSACFVFLLVSPSFTLSAEVSESLLLSLFCFFAFFASWSASFFFTPLFRSASPFFAPSFRSASFFFTPSLRSLASHASALRRLRLLLPLRLRLRLCLLVILPPRFS
mmetsp:Transcript_61131/g.171001  ORF Transcript_61131/g.171001 Transcript_61131/m.171001 type:complete len:388 (-) Transcript_61131:778-1941(-)